MENHNKSSCHYIKCPFNPGDIRCCLVNKSNKSDIIGAIDPVHYTQTEIEPIVVIEKWSLSFNLGSAIKYIARHRFSGSKKKDLIKAANYCYREATGKWLPRELQDVE